jgi:hypothetical protein
MEFIRGESREQTLPLSAVHFHPLNVAFQKKRNHLHRLFCAVHSGNVGIKRRLGGVLGGLICR